MGKTGTVKHTHQYFRRPDNLWACSGIEGCTHYMPKNMTPAPVGRMSICWSCEKEFQLTPVNMRTDKPMCDECTYRGDILDKIIEEKLKEVEKDPYSNFRTPGYYAKRASIVKPITDSGSGDQVEVIEECRHIYSPGVDICIQCGFVLKDE